MRRAEVYFQNRLSGWLIEDEQGYLFRYDLKYLKNPEARPISFSFPLTEEGYRSALLFPFFDNLIPEGWFLDIASKSLKIDSRDRFGMLLGTAAHTIGAVEVRVIKEDVVTWTNA